MRLLITVVVGGNPCDLAIDVEDAATVHDLAIALGEQFNLAVAMSNNGRTVPSLRVVGERARSIGAPPPPLFVGSIPLDPGQPLIQSPIRHACVVGVGAPVVGGFVEPRGLVEIRTIAGPGVGSVVRLDPGEYSFGGAEGNDVRLLDPGLPKFCGHLRVTATGQVDVLPDPGLLTLFRPAPLRRMPLPGPIVIDTYTRPMAKKPKPGQVLPDGTVTAMPHDPIPVLHLDRRAVTGPFTWVPGTHLSVGLTQLELRPVHRPDASVSINPAGATLDYNRPPRLLPPSRQTAFTLPTEPKVPDKQPFPLLMVLAPAIMGVAMYLMIKSPYVLIMVAFSPIMALGNYTTGRRQGKQRYRQDFTEFAQRTERIQQDAHRALLIERGARRHDFADPAEVLMTAVGPRARLWERRQTDPDFLAVRVGVGDQVSDVTVKDPKSEQHEGALAWTAPDVPVTVPLAEVGVTGITGNTMVRNGLARWVLSQTAVLQSPADVDLILLGDAAHAEDWNWLRWLPHVRSDIGDSELAHVGVDEESIGRRLAELGAILQERMESLSSKGGVFGGGSTAAAPFDPILVVLDGARRLRLLPGVPQLLQMGPRVRMYFLCLDSDRRLLPEECQAVIDADHHDVTVMVSGHPTVEAVRPDLVSTQWAEIVARAVAPIRDVSDIAAGGSLPSSSRLLDVIRLDPPTPEGVLECWDRVGRTTDAVIGEGAEGPFSIDIRRDGPHGLVAGTTGSGKSELLQTIIASLAVNNRPDEMNFVLVDYKGGAAFKDCNNLPHTVGMVTDLDGHLTGRALESLGAELRRREHQLAGADAKDIEDYLATKGPDDEPMPRLLIVIDEFAALVAELPDFVTGLVDIARRGRSLGVHLILATQRPAGVVSAEIKSNTNLRIALRVTDAGDSADVLEAPDAAQIAKSTPGRGYARLGHSSLIPFQSSRVGGRPRGEEVAADIDIRAVRFADLGTPVARSAAGEEDITIPTDLAAFVEAARAASDQSGVKAPPSPWLPALPDVLTLEEVLAEFPAALPTAERLVIPFGLTDIPAEQRRDVAMFDIEHGGHLAVTGAPRVGRSTILRALAGAIGSHTSPRDVHLYGVDCGNNALLPLVGLPHVGAVVTRDQVDRMDRLVERLRQTISERQQELAVGGFADVAEQRANVPVDARLPYLVVLFDRWEGFFQAYDGLDGGRLVTSWQQILQEGAAVGIKVVMTGDRSMLMGRMSTLLDDKLLMRMTDPSDFGAIGMGTKQVPDSMVEGRAFRSEGVRETQVVLLDPDSAGTAQVAALQQIGRDAAARHGDLPREVQPFRLDVLPVRVTMAEARGFAAEPLLDSTLVLAVGGDTLALRTLDAFEHGPAILVTGPRRSGRSTTLRTMATFALEQGWKVVVVTPRVSPLRDLASHPDVLGPFDVTSDQSEVTALFAELRESPDRVLTLVDDVELLGADDWLPTLLSEHLEKIRDSGSVLAAAGTPAEMGSLYRGPVVALKRSGSGMMLAPQSMADADMFGARMARSAFGQSLPPGGGFLMRTGSAERVQVIWPE